MGSMNLENKTTALDDDAAIYQHTEATETANEKLSEMTFKEKVRYLFDYYGLKALIVLAVLVFLGYTLWAMLRPKPETVAQIAIIDNPWDTSLLDDYQEELIEKLKLDTKKQELPLGYSYRSSNLSDGTALSTFLFANNLDILISSKDDIVINAYNKPYIKPLIRKTDAGEYEVEGRDSGGGLPPVRVPQRKRRR